MTEAEKKAIAYHQRLHDLLREAYNIATDMQMEDTLRSQMSEEEKSMLRLHEQMHACPLCGNAETCKECEPPLKYAELKPIKAEVYDVHRAIKDFAVATALPFNEGIDQIKYLVRRYPILCGTCEFAAWAKKYRNQFHKGV